MVRGKEDFGLLCTTIIIDSILHPNLGTQRLIRAIGKSKAMEMILTGKMVTAEQAEKDGLVSRVVEADALLDDALKLGFVIGSKGQISVRMAKEAVNAADEMSLEQVSASNMNMSTVSKAHSIHFVDIVTICRD